jgi:predicted flap endonuclease-1-like 5' DNA nuclease
MSYYNIKEIEGIGPANAEKLDTVGIKTTEKLLELCGDKTGRKNVSAQTGISESVLLEWANRADLMRINGIGEEYSDLLEQAGVDTVKELATRNVANLAEKIAEVNEGGKYANATPSETVIEKWVAEAKTLPPKISH